MNRVSVKTYLLMAIIIAAIIIAGALLGMEFGMDHGQNRYFGFAVGLIAFGIFLFPLFLGNFIMYIVCMVNGDDGAYEHTGLRRFTAAAYLIVFALLIGFTVWGNIIVETEYFTTSSKELPPEFDGFKIAHVSDLHNEVRGEGNSKIIDILKAEEPDMIAITGDFIDGDDQDFEVCYKFAERVVEIAPCYFVVGNHEAKLSDEKYFVFEDKLREIGFTVLHNEEVELQHNGATITVAALDDPTYAVKRGRFSKSYSLSTIAKKEFEGLITGDRYTLLLVHRPDYFSMYAKSEADLVLAGHIHGGYFRLPYIGGIAGPGTGLLPDYDAGMFSTSSMDMIVSCGIASSSFPFRFNNPPEIGIVELKTK